MTLDSSIEFYRVWVGSALLLPLMTHWKLCSLLGTIEKAPIDFYALFNALFISVMFQFHKKLNEQFLWYKIYNLIKQTVFVGRREYSKSKI
jgi:hypothetical protein